jgi:uncharacterized protein
MAVSTFRLMDEELWLLPQRAIYFCNIKTLTISDLHLGKVNHFRKSGIPVPLAANHANTETLVKLMMEIKPSRVIFIGDLFHSSYNAEWDVLGQVIKHFRSCSFELVPGNHDIMGPTQYEKHHIRMHESYYPLTDKITLAHEPVDVPSGSAYYLSGHVHPAITLSGKGRQSLTFPCFWFGKHQGLLPAFGVFTGFKSIRSEECADVFAVVGEEVIEVSMSRDSALSNRK